LYAPFLGQQFGSLFPGPVADPVAPAAPKSSSSSAPATTDSAPTADSVLSNLSHLHLAPTLPISADATLNVNRLPVSFPMNPNPPSSSFQTPLPGIQSLDSSMLGGLPIPGLSYMTASASAPAPAAADPLSLSSRAAASKDAKPSAPQP